MWQTTREGYEGHGGRGGAKAAQGVMVKDTDEPLECPIGWERNR